MTSTTMRFGPEWMRKQPAPTKPLATSPPPSGASGGTSNGTAPAPPGVASYSALVTPHTPLVQGKRDIAHPFKYSRDEMLQVFRDLGGCSELPIEVERWDGVVRETPGDPVSLRDFTEVEKKLYATSLNSEIRRRQPSDYAVQGDRSKGGTLNSGLGLMSRRRRGDSNGAEHPPLSLPRKTSWSGASGNLVSPSATSPRTRIGSNNTLDSVLNSSESAWGGGKRRIASGQPVTDRLDEEEETQKDPPLDSKVNTNPLTETKGSEGPPEEETLPTPETTPQNSNKDADDAIAAMSNLTLKTGVASTQGAGQVVNDAGPTDVNTADIAKVEWSYIDPSGTVQGPFTAEQMQVWSDQGYFTDNLLMKRTHIDTEFTPLTDIKRRAQGERVFLSSLMDQVPPPGLDHPLPAHAFNPLLQRTGIVDPPRQSSPQSYGRSNALDSLIANGSVSGSPSSSLGGSFARGPISPEPIAIGSRFQRFDAVLNGRVSAAGSYSSGDSPAIPHATRQTYNEPPAPNRTSSMEVPGSGNVPWQLADGNVMQGWSGMQDGPHLGRFDGVPSSFGHPQFMRDSAPYLANANAFFSPQGPHRLYDQPQALGASFQQMPQEPPRFNGASRQPSLPQLNTGFDRGFDQMSSPAAPVSSNGIVSNLQQHPQTGHSIPLSPWGQNQPPRPRPGPFDADMPTANNTYIVSPTQPQTQPWARPQGPRGASVAQATGQDSQHQLTEEPQSLTTANVIQHNEQQRLMDSGNQVGQHTPTLQADSSVPTTIDVVTNAPEASAQNKLQGVVQTAPSRQQPPKGMTSSVPPETRQPAAAVAVPKVSTVPSTSQKARWATDEERKSKQPAPMNLREIQEAEKKKQESRKNSEKGRERISRAASGASANEEVQFIASWGLPTSQVGARSNGAPAAKEPPAISPVSSTPSAPVWTNAAKPAAKTMREIQEEEERRKQAAKERESTASLAKKTAQAPVAKASVAPSQPGGGAWTVVGSGGKSQTAASGVRPAATAQTSAPNVQSAASRPAAAQRTASIPAVTKAAPSSSKTDEEPVAPSLEFMKWMRESLRGLNSSVQFEEIAQMLLSFPLDPDKLTEDIIAETVYGASTTLNGRDYAKEFVKRRKEDVLARSKNSNGQSANGKPVSLADVVKAQPKTVQNDFGAFKVVKKKNKRP